MDGINTTDTKTQTWGCQFEHDAIADINVMTGGVPAEYGGMLGAVTNVVTKSGSNMLHGMARFEMDRAAWNDVSERNPDRTDDNDQYGSDNDQWDYTGGGPLYPDVFWWFVGYHPSSSVTYFQKQLDPLDVGKYTKSERWYIGHFLNLKGTIQIGEDIKVTGFFKEDPIDIPNRVERAYGGNTSAWLGNVQPGAGGLQEQGGQGYLGQATWVFMENAFLTARYWHDGNYLNIVPNDDNGFETFTGDTDVTMISADRWVWGGFYCDYQSDRNKDAVAAEINYLLDTESLGSHDIKVGFEYADHNTGTGFWYGNRNAGYIIYTDNVEGVGFDNVKWLEKEVVSNYLPYAVTHLYYYSNFIQDSIQLTDKLTLNLGLRMDPFSGECAAGAGGEEVVSVGQFETIAPRIGFAYDFDGNSLHGSASRYYDTFSMYAVAQMNYFTTPETHSFYKAIGGDGEANGFEATPYDSYKLGDPSVPHSIDEDITPNYMDEVTLGYDHLFTNDVAASGYFVWRTWRDLNSMWDSGAEEDGDYVWQNLETDDYGTKYKQYMAFVFDARKRPTADNLFLNANVTLLIFDEGFATHSISTGGYGSYGSQTAENADSWWHDYGNPNWRAKLQGTYFFPNNWYAGLTIDYRAGYSYTSQTYTGAKAAPDGYIYTYAYPKGWNDLGRLDPVPTVDLQFGFEQTIEFPFEVPFTDNNIMLGLYVNFANLINFEGATSLDPSMDSSTYGEDDDWMNARSYTLGLRLEL
jgi:hypothetical protein